MWGGLPPAPNQVSVWTFRQIGAYPGIHWKPGYHKDKIGGSQTVMIPLWIIVALSGMTTAYAWRRDFVLRRSLKLGTCPHCGFSLSGLAPDAVCPECGKAR
jgi:hypothetical protein